MCCGGICPTLEMRKCAALGRWSASMRTITGASQTIHTTVLNSVITRTKKSVKSIPSQDIYFLDRSVQSYGHIFTMSYVQPCPSPFTHQTKSLSMRFWFLVCSNYLVCRLPVSMSSVKNHVYLKLGLFYIDRRFQFKLARHR